MGVLFKWTNLLETSVRNAQAKHPGNTVTHSEQLKSQKDQNSINGTTQSAKKKQQNLNGTINNFTSG